MCEKYINKNSGNINYLTGKKIILIYMKIQISPAISYTCSRYLQYEPALF
jgi:hypothetical protein